MRHRSTCSYWGISCAPLPVANNTIHDGSARSSMRSVSANMTSPRRWVVAGPSRLHQTISLVGRGRVNVRNIPPVDRRVCGGNKPSHEYCMEDMPATGVIRRRRERVALCPVCILCLLLLSLPSTDSLAAAPRCTISVSGRLRKEGQTQASRQLYRRNKILKGDAIFS